MFQIDLIKLALPLKRKFKVSKGEADVKENMLLVLNNRYISEASGSVFYGPSNDEIIKEIEKGILILEKSGEINKESLIEISQFDINPIAKSTLTGVVLNYLSGESKRYPWEIINLGTPVGVKSSVTVSLDTPDAMVDQIKASNHSIVKIKLGQADDLKLIEALDKVEGKQIRVDANGGWSCAQAEEMIFKLAEKGVTIIEQPTDLEFIEEWGYLKGKNKDLELIIDEGLNSLEDYKKYSAYVDGVNIKMEKSGGILEAVKIAEAAASDHKKVMLGCMVGSSAGIAQSLYMSSRADYFDLDGPLLLKDDIAIGINYDNESIEVDREIIGGPKLRREIIEKYITK